MWPWRHKWWCTQEHMGEQRKTIRNLISWRQALTSSPPNHIHLLLVRKRALVVTAGNTPCNVIMHNVITMVNNEATHMRWYVQIIDRSRIQVDTMKSWNEKSNLRPTYFLYSWIEDYCRTLSAILSSSL